jgi:hypothetical protein
LSRSQNDSTSNSCHIAGSSLTGKTRLEWRGIWLACEACWCWVRYRSPHTHTHTQSPGQIPILLLISLTFALRPSISSVLFLSISPLVCRVRGHGRCLRSRLCFYSSRILLPTSQQPPRQQMTAGFRDPSVMLYSISDIFLKKPWNAGGSCGG